MKIGVVSPYDCTWPGGVLTHISHLSRQFSQMGHEVKILAPHSPARPQAEEGTFVLVGRSVPVPYGGSIARISLSLWLYRRVQALLEQEHFDVVHVHEPLAPILPLYALQCSQSLNVGTFHAFYSSPRRYRLSHRVLRRWFNRLHGRIAVSPGACQQVSLYFPGEYRIIPNGIDVDHFSAPAPPLPQFDDGKINILFVGRLEKRKGLRYLLEAYSRVKWDYPNTRLLVVGPGQPDSDCWKVLSERSLRDVVFTSNVPNAELPRYYASSHIFCAPATGRESFGVVLLEAMAAGKPIVATNIQGYSAVVQHGEQALLVPPKDSVSLADALCTLIRNPELRHQLGQAGRQGVERYRWEVIAGQVMDYYNELQAGRDGAAA